MWLKFFIDSNRENFSIAVIVKNYDNYSNFHSILDICKLKIYRCLTNLQAQHTSRKPDFTYNYSCKAFTVELTGIILR